MVWINQKEVKKPRLRHGWVVEKDLCLTSDRRRLEVKQHTYVFLYIKKNTYTACSVKHFAWGSLMVTRETALAVQRIALVLPPLLVDSDTLAKHSRVERFYFSVVGLFDAWLHRCCSAHTRRTYQATITHFVRLRGLRCSPACPLFFLCTGYLVDHSSAVEACSVNAYDKCAANHSTACRTDSSNPCPS